jgi:phosphate binding protein
VEGSKYAIGYFGYAYFAEEAGKLKAVPVAKGADVSAAVEPSQETVDAATYPLARPLFIYSDAKIMQEKPQVAAFIKFYLDSLEANITEVGYFPAPAKEISRAYGRLWYATDATTVDAAAVEGDIITAGSSTVFPLTERMAEKFEQEGFGGTVTVDSVGTGAGFERFCKAGETDVSNASRAIKQEEIDNCKAIGREPLEFRVGTDALAVVVSADNDFIDYLTITELATAFSTATTWADVRAGWPAEPIQRFSPGTDSGTFDYFIEAVMQPKNGGDADAGEKALLESEGTQYSEDDNVLAQGVEGSKFAIGYFGYAYFANEAGKLKAVPVVSIKSEEAAAGDAEAIKKAAITPDVASVNAGTYPLARPLYIYSDAKVMQEKPQVAAFILFYLTQVNNEVLDVGYFPASDNALGTAYANWLAGNGN